MDNSDVIALQEAYGGYWGDHPDYPVSDWQYEVENGDTREGYWTWVLSKLESAEDEEECDEEV